MKIFSQSISATCIFIYSKNKFLSIKHNYVELENMPRRMVLTPW